MRFLMRWAFSSAWSAFVSCSCWGSTCKFIPSMFSTSLSSLGVKAACTASRGVDEQQWAGLTERGFAAA